MGTSAWGGLQGRALFHNKEIADDETIALTGGRAMLGMAIICDAAGTNVEYAIYYASEAAAVTLLHNSANVDTADTDAKFDIYDGGTKVYVKNRLGWVGYVTIFCLYASNGAVPFGVGAP